MNYLYPEFYRKIVTSFIKQLNFQNKMGIVQTTDENFQVDVISSQTPVLVDFWAEWCGPCKMIAPALEELDQELNGKIKIVKVDVDNSKKTAMDYAIRSIPTLIIFSEGAVKAQHIGAASKAQIQEFINQNI
ncbi:MAG: thioredoxin [Chloroflexi bacterium]|nr:thioredoxin [Chloroflexota bacterium]|tara:strand:- start:32 stop:427 length:396 start_codon:yes stop_codon:yes gene_type:complete